MEKTNATIYVTFVFVSNIQIVNITQNLVYKISPGFFDFERILSVINIKNCFVKNFICIEHLQSGFLIINMNQKLIYLESITGDSLFLNSNYKFSLIIKVFIIIIAFIQAQTTNYLIMKNVVLINSNIQKLFDNSNTFQLYSLFQNMFFININITYNINNSNLLNK